MQEFLYYAGEFMSEHSLITAFFTCIMPWIALASIVALCCKTPRVGGLASAAILVYVVFLLFVGAYAVFVPDDYRPPVQSRSVATTRPAVTARPTSTPRATTAPLSFDPQRYFGHVNVKRHYENNHPETYRYIYKYAENPEAYLYTYDGIWGDLQDYIGDGIPFDTLTPYEQSLVDYPEPGAYIWVVSGRSTYHNTPDCFTLLRSTEVERYAYSSHVYYNPCSKCVGD